MRLCIAILVSLMLYGCGGSMPGCDDDKVTVLIKDILKESNVKLIRNTGITTIKKTDNTCLCKSLAEVEMFSLKKKIGLVYEINMADNGSEFTVSVKAE